MPDDDYIDESPETLREAWKRGEPGVTKGTKDLNQRARNVVDAVIDRWEPEPRRVSFGPRITRRPKAEETTSTESAPHTAQHS
jgi:hypothetical protein